MALNAWEAGEVSKGYLLLSEEQSWHQVLWLGKCAAYLDMLKLSQRR